MYLLSWVSLAIRNIYCLLCGKTDFRFYCGEFTQYWQNIFRFGFIVNCIKPHKILFPSWFEVSVLLCLFHSCWLGITCISVFFIFPFFIFPAPFEIAQQSLSAMPFSRCFSELHDVRMTFSLQWSRLRVD